MRQLTTDTAGVFDAARSLICDCDPNASGTVDRVREFTKIRVIWPTNGKACTNRFVRWRKEECLGGIDPLMEHRLRRALTVFIAHHDNERNL